MTISSLCRRDVVGISAEASLHEVATVMCEEHVGALVVMSGADPPQVVGILTDRDLALEVLGRTGPAGDLRAGHVAKSPPVAVLASASLQEAVTVMEKAGVRRLLVVDDDGGVVGILAAEDLMAAISEELAGLVRALRSGIEREKGERSVMVGAKSGRPVFAGFGTIAMQ
jgi:CBS domain-containing protein